MGQIVHYFALSQKFIDCFQLPCVHKPTHGQVTTIYARLLSMENEVQMLTI